MKALTTKIDQSVMSGTLRKTAQRDIARRSAALSIRTTPEGAYYRFRLLSFAPDEEFTKAAGLKYYRDIAFLPRHMHVVWTEEPSDKSPTGVRRVRHEIPCPASEYIRVNSNLTKKTCPICSAGNQALQAYTDSHKNNQVAKAKWLNCRSEFDALVPVYVVNDPNNDANNGSVRIWRVTEDQYNRIVAIVNEAERGKTPVFNDEAVDLYFSFGLTDKSRTNKKTGETRTWKQNDIIKMGLTTNPYKLNGLDDLVKGLNFDANWYTIPTLEELQDFYAKYIATPIAPMNDIPNDIPADPGAGAWTPPTPKPAPAPAKKVAPPPVAEPVVEAAPAPSPAAVTATTPNESDITSDIDSFMNGITL